ncbi:uncharacterized protein BDZ83DRAFT_623375 [Colletotrichum acutatum]|uniref:Uncharacterized protein n=1 Tax=Glomerella acutata TaxID=27357 RepID=A0AAD8XEJ4_GLOAC|nr:uncharacterized protein BDZ83DRAFT_623375 [Colletotrichum acutatum]KAK1724347.1 hypothetical protein BDZ83DRAFT_623375 [Colletotrichum acutatum]
MVTPSPTTMHPFLVLGEGSIDSLHHFSPPTSDFQLSLLQHPSSGILALWHLASTDSTPTSTSHIPRSSFLIPRSPLPSVHLEV